MGLAAIPVIGGTAVEAFQFMIQAPIERRRDVFVQQLGEQIFELQEKGINLENLQQNEQFISAVLQVTQTALRTHQVEKLTALRNVIANLAQGQSLDDTLLHILLFHIDSLSEMHLRILIVVYSPKIPAQWHGDGTLHSREELVSHNIPELQGSPIAQQLLVDLNARGLIGVDLMHSGQIEDLRRGITPLGESLIRLITVPGDDSY
jgi:hypothetical protein